MGDLVHGKLLNSSSYYLWVNDRAEGFISDVAIPVELPYSSWTSNFCVV
jgi:hypothetical protein